MRVRTYVQYRYVRRVVRLMSGVPLARSMFGRWGGARSLDVRVRPVDSSVGFAHSSVITFFW